MTSDDQLPDVVETKSSPSQPSTRMSLFHDNTATFTDTEVLALPSSIKASLSRASHHAATRKMLHKYDVFRKDVKRPLGYSTLDKDGGYDDLTEIKTLAEFQTERKTMVDEVLSTVAAIRTEEHIERRVKGVKEMIQVLSDDIRASTWIPKNQHDIYIDILMSDIKNRMKTVYVLMHRAGVTVAQSKSVLYNLFLKIGEIKNLILEKCRSKHDKMISKGIFDDETNSTRLQSFFRTELSKRIITEDLVKTALQMMSSAGSIAHQIKTFTHQELFTLELQKLNDYLSHTQLKSNDLSLSIPKGLPPLKKTKVAAFERKMEVKEETANSQESLRIMEREKAMDGMLQDLQTLLQRNEKERRKTNMSDSDTDEEEDVFAEASAEEMLFRTHVRDAPPVKDAHEPESTLKLPKYRYLIPSKEREQFLLSWDEFQKLVDEEPVKEEKSEIPDTPLTLGDHNYQQVSLHDSTKAHAFTSHFSSLAPKGTLPMSTDPVIGSNGFEITGPSSEQFDERLLHYREVEDTFNNLQEIIMENYLDAAEDMDPLRIIPAATFDPSLPPVPRFLGYTVPISDFEKQFPTNVPSQRQKLPRQHIQVIGKPRIVLRPTLGNSVTHITADEFIENRNQAMSKLRSSKLRQFKYNFGGYVPASVVKTERSKEEGEFDDFERYIEARTCDFLHTLLLPEEEKDEGPDEAWLLAQLEEERRRKERGKPKQPAPVRYERGRWNPAVISYIAELKTDETPTTQPDSTLTTTNGEQVQLAPIVEERRPSLSTKPNQAATWVAVSTSEMNKALLKSEHDDNVPNVDESQWSHDRIQRRLEALWFQLRVPEDQKIAMAVKYSSWKFLEQLQDALNAWEEAVMLILDREQLLPVLEEFEERVADPLRFYSKTVEEREEETTGRNNYLQTLKEMDDEIYRTLDRIKKHFDDIVTLDGIPYVDKMAHDYSSILYRARIRFETSALHQRPHTTSTSSPRRMSMLTSFPLRQVRSRSLSPPQCELNKTEPRQRRLTMDTGAYDFIKALSSLHLNTPLEKDSK